MLNPLFQCYTENSVILDHHRKTTTEKAFVGHEIFDIVPINPANIVFGVLGSQTARQAQKRLGFLDVFLVCAVSSVNNFRLSHRSPQNGANSIVGDLFNGHTVMGCKIDIHGVPPSLVVGLCCHDLLYHGYYESVSIQYHY